MTMYKKQSVVGRERALRKLLNWSINRFDKPKGATHKWTWVSQAVKDENPNGERQFTDLRKKYLPELLKIYLSWDSITLEQVNTLTSQLQSPDRENWYIAFILIKSLKPHKVRKHA